MWFATAKGRAGYADPNTRRVETIDLGGTVANSISTAPGGTAVVTDRALYYLAAKPGKQPRIVWKAGYSRGPVRKPGQLSQGSGATPTFFGPYLAITDNAAPQERLLVYDTRARSRRTHAKKVKRICALPVVDGTENSPIGRGHSLYVASTYGYPYPAEPEDQPAAEPSSAPFTGGLSRVDVGAGGCQIKWKVAVRSAAVPRLSLADGLIYTVERVGAATTGPLDSYALVTVDAATGEHQVTPDDRREYGDGHVADGPDDRPWRCHVPGHDLGALPHRSGLTISAGPHPSCRCGRGASAPWCGGPWRHARGRRVRARGPSGKSSAWGTSGHSFLLCDRSIGEN